MKLSRVGGTKKHVVRWEHDNVTLTLALSVEYAFGPSYIVVQPMVLGYDFEGIARRMARDAGHGTLKSKQHKKLVSLLRETLPATFTVGGSDV